MKAGFARVDITPPLGTYMWGYFTDRFGKGILDPLELNALAFSDGEKTALLIIADLIAIDTAICDELRTEISAATGLERDAIMLTALHQHTSCAFFEKQRGRTRGAIEMPTDAAYHAMLHIKYCDVAKMALADMSEASLSYAERETAEQIAFVRRYYMKDGSVATNPAGRAADIDRPCDEPDNTVRLVRFQREGKNDILLLGFCTHPDVIGGELYSADWPGFARRYTEESLNRVSCLLLNGVQGDSNHSDFVHGVQTGYGHAAHMGRVIAETAVAAFNTVETVEAPRVAGAVRTVFMKTRTDGIEDYERCVKLLEDLRAGRLSYRPTMAERGHAGRIRALRGAPAFAAIPLTVLRLGPIALVGFGGEPFTHYATLLREACPDTKILTACCANGYEGYFPSEKAFLEGGYEANSSPFYKDIESDCTRAAVDLIEGLL